MYFKMKKTYVNPEMSIVLMQNETVLAASGVTGNNGVDYGGVDENGDKDPDVKAEFFDFEW